MTILEKINQLHPNGGFVGGLTSLIVGPVGIGFQVYHSSDAKSQIWFKENDAIPITNIKDGKVFIRPFLNEIPVSIDGKFKGLKYSIKSHE
jgi:hypothetical protein